VTSVQPGQSRSARRPTDGALRGAVVAMVFVAVFLVSAFFAVRRFERVHVRTAVGPLPAPAPGDRGGGGDGSERCADVGDACACWGSGATGGECRDGACVVPRPTPPDAAPAMGWRCDGQGAARVCEDRRRNGSSFACDAVGSCVQPEPRMPDDNEWECVDIDGVAYCHLTARASAVVPGPPDLGWICGTRRGHSGEPVCVDLSPDRPDARGYKCTFVYSKFYPTRVCVRSDAPQVGGACVVGDGAPAASPQRGQHEAGCPADATCIAGRCVPPAPKPDCWIDSDCGSRERCRWASCTAGGA
jgi:hypothetical protein